jgi:hypothetical protein
MLAALASVNSCAASCVQLEGFRSTVEIRVVSVRSRPGVLVFSCSPSSIYTWFDSVPCSTVAACSLTLPGVCVCRVL